MTRVVAVALVALGLAIGIVGGGYATIAHGLCEFDCEDQTPAWPFIAGGIVLILAGIVVWTRPRSR